MPAKRGPSAGPSSPRKAARLNDLEHPLQRASAVEALLTGLETPSTCRPTWSCTNLLAIPTPLTTHASVPFTDTPTAPISVTLTHFAGVPSLPTASNKGKGRSRLSLALSLPPSATRVTLMSFAPCGGHLLVVAETEEGELLTVFEQTGCVNEWETVWSERVEGFGEGVVKRVVGVRWLGEGRKWYPLPATATTEGDPVTIGRPLLCTPHRSPPVVGSAFVLVLSSSELLFVHLPRSLTIHPVTLLLPLSTPSSQTALPTPPTTLPTLPLVFPPNGYEPPSPFNPIDHLVAKLVDTMPNSEPSPGAVAGVLNLDGGGAMRVELSKAMEGSGGRGGRKEVRRACVGIARSEGETEWGLTTLLIATVAGEGRLRRRGEEETTEGEVDEEGEDGERSVDLFEVRVEMTAQEGPRLSTKPLSSIHLSDPTQSAGDAPGILTHLEWIEEIACLPASTTRVLGSEASIDLRLLAVFAKPNLDGEGASSSLASWALSNEPYALSEAFMSLESRKADVTVGTREWVARRSASSSADGLITFVAPRSGPIFSSFIAGEVVDGSDGVKVTRVAGLSSDTLLRLPELGETLLPSGSLYAEVQLSPNRALLCATPYARGSATLPAMAAVPIGSDPSTLATHLAISVVRQVDSSDLVGRVISLQNDASTVDVVRGVRDILQGMLTPPRMLESTSLQLELLGLTATLHSQSPDLAMRGSIARDIVQLAACVRAFKKCEKKERGVPDVGYRCESDAVWPLIGHLSWFCDLCRDLVKTCNVFSSDSPPARHILLLHPLPRRLLLRIAEDILGLQAFLATFPPNSNITVDISRTVLDDAVDYNGLVLGEWRNLLLKIGEIPGLGQDSEELRNMLVTFTIPASLHPSTTLITTHLSSPLLLLPSSLLPSPPTPTIPLDIIRKARLTPLLKLRQCTKCAERSQRRDDNGRENAVGKWGAWEMAWEARCSCGGLWVAA